MSCDLCKHQLDAEGIVEWHSDGGFSCCPFACPLYKTDGQKCENFVFKDSYTIKHTRTINGVELIKQHNEDED